MQSALTHLDILRRYAKGDRDFSGLNISGIKLSGANLSRTVWLDVNFSKAYLHSTIFTFACLTRANMRGAIMTGANLCGANLFQLLRFTDVGAALHFWLHPKLLSRYYYYAQV